MNNHCIFLSFPLILGLLTYENLFYCLYCAFILWCKNT